MKGHRRVISKRSATTVDARRRVNNSITIGACARWRLNGTSNMAVMEVTIATGYTADVASLESLVRAGLKRYEVTKDTVVLYFDEVWIVRSTFENSFYFSSINLQCNL